MCARQLVSHRVANKLTLLLHFAWIDSKLAAEQVDLVNRLPSGRRNACQWLRDVDITSSDD